MRQLSLSHARVIHISVQNRFPYSKYWKKWLKRKWIFPPFPIFTFFVKWMRKEAFCIIKHSIQLQYVANHPPTFGSLSSLLSIIFLWVYTHTHTHTLTHTHTYTHSLSLSLALSLYSFSLTAQTQSFLLLFQVL